MGMVADLLAVVGIAGLAGSVLWMASLAARTSRLLAVSCLLFPPAFAVARHRQPVTMRPFRFWLVSGSLLLTGLYFGAPVHI